MWAASKATCVVLVVRDASFVASGGDDFPSGIQPRCGLLHRKTWHAIWNSLWWSKSIAKRNQSGARARLTSPHRDVTPARVFMGFVGGVGFICFMGFIGFMVRHHCASWCAMVRHIMLHADHGASWWVMIRHSALWCFMVGHGHGGAGRPRARARTCLFTRRCGKPTNREIYALTMGAHRHGRRGSVGQSATPTTTEHRNTRARAERKYDKIRQDLLDYHHDPPK